MFKIQTHYKVAAVAIFVLALGFLSGGKAHAASLNVPAGSDDIATNGDCQLSEAIININDQTQTYADCAAGDGNNDSIVLAPGTITLTDNLPSLTSPVKIQGAGMGQSIIDGAGQWRTIVTAESLSIDALSITGYAGAGIQSQGSDITVEHVEIDGSNALFSTGFPSNAYGITIINDGAQGINVSISNVYIHDITTNGTSNVFPLIVATGDNGTGVSGDVTASINNVTVANISGSDTVVGIITSAGMSSLGFGSGVVSADLSNITMYNISSTGGSAGGLVVGAATSQDHVVSANVKNITIANVSGTSGSILGGSTGVGIALFTGGFVDGINNELNVTLQNALVSNSGIACYSSDISSSVFNTNSTSSINASSQGGNLSDSSCPYFTLSTDQNNITNLKDFLGPLSSNGGYVPTIPLLQGSPAIDNGITIAGLTTDARGVTRPQGQAYDSGAYEYVPTTSLAGTGENMTALLTLSMIAVIVSLIATACRLKLHS